MNKMITTREELLAVARGIVVEQGIEHLSIRLLAQQCGIAIGSVYNYFPSKSELLLALVDSFWRAMYHPGVWDSLPDQPFPQRLEALYGSLAPKLQEFRLIYSGQLAGLREAQRQQGKERENRYLADLLETLGRWLAQDSKIRQGVWSDSFTKEQFAQFVFENMFVLLVQGSADCRYLTELIGRILY